MCVRKLEDRSTLDILFSKYKGQVGGRDRLGAGSDLASVANVLRWQERPLYNMICKKYAVRNTTSAAETEMPAHSPAAQPTSELESNTGYTPLLQS